MPKYLIQSRYTPEGAKGLLAEGGTARRAVVDAVVTGLGGTVESVYFAFGGDDLITIVDLPDEASMAAVSLTVTSSGAITTRTTPLLTAAQLDEATRKKVDFRAPQAG
ncbi:GYD domain-containing protein [Streptomyces sp. ICBB 8177]|uniref:GYD domain-containing protein n=1 Tax=Streptomyces sp. ICBB 8177 TaxID=563922 RepID=UPI000D67849D|nr:GYD domain-containing protein [Streptomyces sp. ICBB 8177]PWI43832.1 GYD domain protein [Streptomyces sp. ICBB 8177]